MSWQEIYKEKLRSVEDAAKVIEEGDIIWMSNGTSSPIQLMEAITARADTDGLKGVTVVASNSFYPFTMFKEGHKYAGKIDYHTTFLGPFERPYAGKGNMHINSCHLGQVYQATKDYYKVNTFVADVSEPDEDGNLYFGPMGCGMGSRMSELSRKIVVQVNKLQRRVKGPRTCIHVSQVDAICEADHELIELPQPPISEVDQKIANYIVPLIEDGSCIQIGFGGLANAVGYGLETKKNLSVHTEMFTDSMMHLQKKGIINGKVVVTFAAGSRELIDYVENHVEMMETDLTNDPREIAKNEKMVAINACLMVDLTGQVCAESVGHRQFSSTGGQLEFVKGAAMSKGGKSFLCVPSSYKDKKTGELSSNIMLNLPPGAVVTTPRSEVMNVVTEYGIAELYNKSIDDRVNAMIAIAHPDFRDELRKGAIAAGLI